LATGTIGPYLQAVQLLGQRTAELHLALASSDDPEFAPEPFSKLYQRGLYQSMRTQARRTLDLLGKQLRKLPAPVRDQAQRVLESETRIFTQFKDLLVRKIVAQRLRCHGDFHLGQVLFTGKDFVIIDFEGEPDKPVGERRIKRSPLRDVAGMIRSLHYASHAGLASQTPGLLIRHDSLPSPETWTRYWYRWSAASFLRSYLATARTGGFLPEPREGLHTLLRAFMLEKALYELRYELNNRPDWVNIPLEGVLELLAGTTDPTTQKEP
jgi:maltose alpha-D-glucosyltransferase/alpha-amylase